MTKTDSQNTTSDDNLAIKHLKGIKDAYSEMGGGVITFDYEIYKDHFEVILRHLPTDRTYEFTFPKDYSYEKFTKVISQSLQGVMRGVTWKGMAS